MLQAFAKWQEHAAEKSRYKELVRKVKMRYDSPLQTKCFLAWVRLVQDQKVMEVKAKTIMMARMSGRADMLAKAFIQAWRELTANTQQRRVELAKKFFARYANALLAKVYLAWAALVSGESDERKKVTLKVVALISGRADAAKVYHGCHIPQMLVHLLANRTCHMPHHLGCLIHVLPRAFCSTLSSTRGAI